MPQVGENSDNEGIVGEAGLMQAELGHLPGRHPATELADRLTPELILAPRANREAQVHAIVFNGKVISLFVKYLNSGLDFVSIFVPKRDEDSLDEVKFQPTGKGKLSKGVKQPG